MRHQDRLPIDEGPDPTIVAALTQAKAVLRELGQRFDALEPDSLDVEKWLEVLAGLGLAQKALQQPGKAIGIALGVRSAKARMGTYLVLHVGEVVDNYALAGVAGTLEWARRVRELELEHGWQITAGPDGGLRPGEYRLEANEVDPGSAERWRLRNEVRRLPGSGFSRCLEYLKRIYPAVASKDDLAYVAKINEWPRRMREIAEEGWPLISSQDDPTLAPGSYRLASLEKGPARSRQAIGQRHDILKRDGWTCRRCGRGPANSAGVVLHIHHKRHVQHGGGNSDDNLITLCVECHLGVHAREGRQVFDELLDPGRDPWIGGRPGDAPDETAT